MQLIGFDVGGTFIDLFAFDSESGAVTVHKVDSSRDELGEAIARGIAELLRAAGAQPHEVARIAHGTTIVTNQIIEGAGARVGVLATRGFRDVLEIGRMRRRSLTDLGDERPRPLVERDLRLEIAERVSATGEVERAADPEAARRAIARLRGLGAESIAVCLLNSYANDANEQVIERVCERAGVPVSLSSGVAPDYGEFERWTTTTLNSYVMPRTQRYLEDVSGRLAAAGLGAPLEIMQSSGGAIPVDVAVRHPVRLIESGPGAGVAAAAQIGAASGCGKIITLDMGGTSADVSVIVDGEPRLISEHDIDGLPVRALGIDVRSVGAGGGSIAYLDAMGALQVGPRSAGADPGPASYGRGGTEPTVTDADLVLGYLDPARFCAGAKPLSLEAARGALARLAEPLGTGIEDLALGIVQIAVARMAGAIRTITTRAGHDPRDCALIALGGAGPTHAALVAAELDIPDVIVPGEPALLSARGLLMADYRIDQYRTVARRLAEIDASALSAELLRLAQRAREQLRSAAAHDEAVQVAHTLELCYEGQQDLVPIPVGRPPLTAADLAEAAGRLDAAFEERYAFLPPNRVPMLMRVRATVLVTLARPPVRLRGAVRSRLPPAARPVVLPGGAETATVIGREALAGELAGPCVVEEDYCSTLVLRGQTVTPDEWGSLRIRAAGGS